MFNITKNSNDAELLHLLRGARNRIWDLVTDPDGQSFKEGRKYLYDIDKKLAEIDGTPLPNRDKY